MKIFGRSLRFGNPKPTDIVIFDETNSHIIRKVINKKYDVTVFNVRPEEIWVSDKVFYGFLRFFSLLDIKEIVNNRRGVVIGIARQLLCIYYLACLDAMNPKAVITFIDNSSRFAWLSKKCHKFPFIAIQNGSRLSYAASKDSDYYVQYLFCFGEHEVNLFPKLGYHVENFNPVGSLVAGLHFDQTLKNKPELYDFLIVSTWRGNIGFQQDVEDTMRSMEVMDKLLARYITENKVNAAVILRAEKNSEHWYMPEIGLNEEQYFRNIYGDSIEIIETDFSKRNIFPLMQQSRLIISCLSTALFEAYGLGKKILYCNFTGNQLYHNDISPLVVTSDDNYENFSSLIAGLLGISKIDYIKLHEREMSYYMSYPVDRLTQEVIEDNIDEIINS